MYLLSQVRAGFSLGRTPMLTYEEASRLLCYDHETGVLTWRIGRRGTACAGSVAGSPCTNKTSKTQYLSVSINGKRYLAHRVCWLLHFGRWPKGYIDHDDHVGTNNRISNLKDVQSGVNNRNHRLHSNNTSGFCGVVRNKNGLRWKAQIWVKGKYLHLGVFDKLSQAVQARQRANKACGFHKNHGKHTRSSSD